MRGYALGILITASLALGLPIEAQSQTDQATDRATSPRTVIVLDVSNSMWGQIGGRSKIEIAREVIAGLIADWNPAVDLGLVAYGHRREGDCNDIETVIPVGPVDPRSFVATVNKLVPRGKTPLTEAVRQAAETLRYRDAPATVVLVSDGIESCRADPCALAEELERAGVDFTVHVVGFDVAKAEDQAQLRCIAENTGGKFLSASTADELATAMATVSAQPTPPLITLEALAVAGGPPVSDPELRWTVVALDREETILAESDEARPELALETGRYFARATLADRAGAVEFDVTPSDIVTHQVILEATVRVSPPPRAEANTIISVPWQGPNNPGDYLAVADPGARDSAFLTYTRTSKGSPAALQLPEIPGHYEVRYVDAKNGKVLAKAAIEATGLTASLDFPEQVNTAESFEVAWQGPGEPGDFITVVAPDAPPASFTSFTRTSEGNPARVTAPESPGDYQVRYVLARTQQPIASAPLAVVIAVELDAPPTVNAGAAFDVQWSGPGLLGDFLTIVNADAKDGSEGNYAWTRNGTPAKLRAPDAAGRYEIRYIAGKSRQTLASLPITIAEVSAALDAVPSASAGAEISITWSGPDNKNDYITVVAAGAKAGSHLKYTYTRQGSPLTVQMPDEPGPYELRYVAGQSNATLASLPIVVTEVTATLNALPFVGLNTPFQVAWTGPDNKNDYIAIAQTGSADNKQVVYTYTRKGIPAKIKAPKEPGQYELRYVMGQSKRVLARLPLTVQ